MKPIYKRGPIQLFHGDAAEVLAQLSNNHISGKIQSVITSPPYALQREDEYASINENNYPNFTLNYFEKIRPLLNDDASIFLVIRPHIKNGQISDYVLKTRLSLRTKWIECEELIWVKAGSPPLGSTNRPRRAWESILWFSNSKKPYCNTKASEKVSSRVGFKTYKFSPGDSFINDGQSDPKVGVARDSDVVSVSVHENEPNLSHPAMYPTGLTDWLIKLSSKEGQTVLDPFSGSGTTGVSCLKLNREYIGIDLDLNYLEESIKRFDREFDRIALEKKKEDKLEQFKSDTVRNNTIIGF